MKKLSTMLWASALIVLTAAPEVLASGTYRARPVRPPDEQTVIRGEEKTATTREARPKMTERELYETGKQLYTGKMDVSGTDVRAVTAPHAVLLSELQAQLPEDARKDANLARLAGHLDADQTHALVHYLQTRYQIEELEPSDPDLYKRGRLLYRKGKGSATGGASPEGRARLAEFAEMARAQDRTIKPVADWSGTLTTAELDALEYYLAVEAMRQMCRH